uniref:Uncharacterized protein n=1 Tax=Oryza sativa subsp. japonica TaxID=39947 RepID=Q5VMA9_ORYSJ|nr:hypothetical protein [Oryza sativa Japonica Group]BAD69416.1 hypothetical protein [Oryza sativa Japonica Group]
MTSFGDGLTSDFMAPATSSTQVVDTMLTSLTTAPSTQPFPLAAFAMEQEVAVQQKMVQEALNLDVGLGNDVVVGDRDAGELSQPTKIVLQLEDELLKRRV